MSPEACFIMKKVLLFMLGTILSFPAFARDFSYEYKGKTIYYTVIDEEAKTCKTTQNPNSTTWGLTSGDVEIPSKVTDGNEIYKVIAIGASTFYRCSNLTSVTLPEGITSIDYSAFNQCSSLNSIIIPNGVTSIGGEALWGCENLASVILPEGLTSIGNNVFLGCKKLVSINIPETVTSIGQAAFYGCNSLSSVNIPDGITSIDWATFRGCNGLSSITIPESVTKIGSEAFGYCSNLTSINIPGRITKISDGTFQGCSNLSYISIPEGVTSIGNNAFQGCSGLTSIYIPEGITSIGDEAFSECGALNSVYYFADRPIEGNANIFSAETYENAILYMSEDGVIFSSIREPWKNFKKIVESDKSGIDGIEADFDENAPCVVYSISGVKVGDSLDGLASGIYIVRQGNKTTKISVK